MTEFSERPYRPGAGIMLVNREGKVFVGQRRDNEADAWQMPQGGIDKGEDPQEAALRELEEETGVSRNLVSIIGATPEELHYDLPEELAGSLWRGKWRGQRQMWYLLRFEGADEDVNINTDHPEFRAWKWIDPEELPDVIVPFKRKLYRDVLAQFRELI